LDTGTFQPCNSASGCTGTKFENMLNTGGNLYQSAAALSKWWGSWTESAYPYPSLDGIYPAEALYQSEFHMRNMYLLPSPWVSGTSNSGQLTYSYSQNNLAAIKNAVYTYGSLFVAYYSAAEDASDFSNFYNADNAAYYDYRQGDQDKADHAVTIVGYDDSFPASRFNTKPPANGAFIVKNSWGTEFGDGGYFYVSYYDTSLQESAHYDLGGGTDGAGSNGYVHNYFLDDFGWQTSWQLSSATGKIANIFTIPATFSPQALDAVQFVTAQPNTSYTIQVYAGVDGVTPDSGTLQPIGTGGTTSVSGTIDLAGYHMVKMPNPAIMRAGTKFAVVITVTAASGNYQMPMEAGSPAYGEDVEINSGESFYTVPGSSWVDLGAYIANYPSMVGSFGNINIKAFTSTPDLTGISISGMQTSYLTGQPFNWNAGTVLLTYVNNGQETFPFSDPLVTQQGYSATAGTKTVTIHIAQMHSSYTVKVANGKLTLDVNGGQKLKKSSYAFKYAGKVSLPTPKRTNYKFLGWYTKKTGGVKVTSSTKLTASQTLYAHWQGVKHTIKFNANHGKHLSKAKMTVTYGAKYGKLATVSRSGYKFLGWYTKKTGGTKVTASKTVKLTASKTLYAHWKKK
ncbi:MAG: lectin like domain-containing protein, partial [Propionibacteriaceae bacterium]|nr:lectin like domain-containing protein [Propionibacteriaceae bacterium]